MAMTQAESYADLWAAHRDRAGPLTPADVWGLREDRHFQPPSRAHLKRLARVRPVIVVARPAPPTVDAMRERFNEADRLGQAVRQLVRPRIPAQPLPVKRLPPMPDGPRIRADHAEARAAQQLAEAARLASRGMIGRGRIWSLSEAHRIYLNI